MSNNNSIYEEEYRGYKIIIEQDDDPMNPREWDNLGTMVCWHRNYVLGDEQPKCDPDEYVRLLLYDYWKDIKQTSLYDHWVEGREENDDKDVDTFIDEMDEQLVWMFFHRYYYMVDIHAYEHGGITISSGKFNDLFDSGQLGFIYVDKIKAEEEFPGLTQEELNIKVFALLNGEIQTYDDYLNSRSYGYIIKDKNENEVDSCWGFYPDHDNKPDYNSCLQEAIAAVDGMIKYQDQLKWEKLEENNYD